MMTTTRGERLRLARKRRFRSARAAALAMGIPASTYGSHERAEQLGGRDYGPDEGSRYARRFGVTLEWLLTGLGNDFDVPFAPETSQPSAAANIPVVGYVGAGGQAYYYAVSEAYLDEIERPELFSEKTVVLEIRDEDLGPLFKRWRVVFDDRREPVTPDFLGFLCVVALEDGRILLRQIRLGSAENRYDLISQHGSFLLDVSVTWAAKVKTILPP